MNTNKHSLKLAVLFLLIGIALSAFGQNKNPSSPITRKGYDFRTKGHDSGMYYLARISELEPVVIAVATKDEKFVEAIKKLVREDDNCENITLLLYDLDPQKKDLTHSVMFLQKRRGNRCYSRLQGWSLVIYAGKAIQSLNRNKTYRTKGSIPGSYHQNQDTHDMRRCVIMQNEAAYLEWPFQTHSRAL